jgi:hypothetical protein
LSSFPYGNTLPLELFHIKAKKRSLYIFWNICQHLDTCQYQTGNIFGAYLASTYLAIWGEKRRKSVDLHVLALNNDVRIDTGTRRILVVHLSDLYRRQVARDRSLSFEEVQAVGVEPSGYAGILYLELADASKLFLLEVEAENTAQQMAYVLRRVMGLPEPVRRAWWQF